MKGHSERVPGKNLRPLGGKPLFFWIVEALERVEAVERIIINTDSDEIAEQAREHFGVVIHRRPAAICGDFVSMNRIIEHDMAQAPQAEHFLQTHATNPLLSSATIAAAVQRYFEDLPTYDSLFSVTRHQARFYDADERPLNHDPTTLLRTQDLPPLFEENSNLYLFSRASFTATGARIGRRPRLFETDPRESVDIDVEADWRLAEAWLAARTGPGGG